MNVFLILSLCLVATVLAMPTLDNIPEDATEEEIMALLTQSSSLKVKRQAIPAIPEDATEEEIMALLTQPKVKRATSCRDQYSTCTTYGKYCSYVSIRRSCPLTCKTCTKGRPYIPVVCKAGEYKVANKCVKCPVNTYSGAGASNCSKCSAGKISKAGSININDCRFEDPCLKKNTDLGQGDIMPWIDYTTNTACKEECEKKTGCVAYTTGLTRAQKYVCILRNSGHREEKVMNSGRKFYSARMTCYADDICLERSYDLPGGDIKSVKWTTIKACKDTCSVTSGCVNFVLDPDTNKCILKGTSHGAKVANPRRTVGLYIGCYKNCSACKTALNEVCQNNQCMCSNCNVRGANNVCVKKYQIDSTLRLYDDAKKECTTNGLNLAVINSDADSSAFKAAAKVVYKGDRAKDTYDSANWIWIGATDLANQGEYRFQNGAILNFTAPWAPKQPDHKQKGAILQRYVAVSRWGEWDDSFGNKWTRASACSC